MKLYLVEYTTGETWEFVTSKFICIADNDNRAKKMCEELNDNVESFDRIQVLKDNIVSSSEFVEKIQESMVE